VKFHLSYFSVFVLGMILPRVGAIDRSLAASCLLAQLPLGLLAFVAPPPWQDVLVYVRWGIYLSGFVLLARAGGRVVPAPLPNTAVQTT